MCESLQLHQGPGLNLMFLTAAPLSWKYDAGSDKTQYVLQPGYTLYVRGNHEAEPCGSLLKPEILKLLDIVTCGLKNGCQVQLPLTEFLQLTGRKVTEPNKDVARRQMKEHKELLRSLSMDWVENEGGYIYSNVKLFDDIDFRCGYLYACFSEKMAEYLLDRPSMPLPLELLAIDGRSPHSYSLGRRCLLHKAINKGQERPICVRSLLAVCPRIPRPDPGKKWRPSELEKWVIAPFTNAMNSLEKRGILTWNFQTLVCRDDYEGFVNCMVEFQTRDTATPLLPAIPALPSEPDTKFVWTQADHDWFHALR